jgi:hypothetical protein
MTALVLLDLVSRARGMFRRNPARTAVRGICRRLEPLHARPFASIGDSGRGLDNTQPWYEICLIVDARPDLEPTVVAAAEAEGYRLRAEEHHLVGERAGRRLRVRITSTGGTSTRATPGRKYSVEYDPPAGKAVAVLSVSLPDRYWLRPRRER